MPETIKRAPISDLPLFGTQRYPDTPAASPDLTSIEAADDAAKWSASLQRTVMRLVEEQPLTVHEAAVKANVSVAAIQPRFSELRRKGQIMPSGEKRVNPTTGKRAMVWQSSELLSQHSQAHPTNGFAEPKGVTT